MVDDDKQSGRNQQNFIESNSIWTRRGFLSKGIAGSLTLISGTFGSPIFAKSSSKSSLDISSLQSKLAGKVFTPQDVEFDKIAFGGLWNKLYPNRAPKLIVSVANEKDVAEVVKYARANQLKVSVRGGGHNWCALSLREGGILIDLTNLNKVISIDAAGRKAVVQPIISNREMQAYLKPYNLAYPTGHCPPVKLSGYLLSGGMAWNQGVWGPGIGSVEAVELVTPEGESITASADENQDYYWAARGAGPGLFAVATRYHLKLHPLPKAIAASVYYYPYEELETVSDWLAPLASQLSANVELSLFILAAPPELVDKCQSSHGKVCMVTATVFADTEEEGKSALKPLDTCPIINKCLSKSIAQPTDFEALFDASGALWPANMRAKTDAWFFDVNLTDIFKSVKDHFLAVPSSKTVFMMAIFTGPKVPAPLPDTAFSMTAKYYGGAWTAWEDRKDDDANKGWHEQCMQPLLSLTCGHYISESEVDSHHNYAKAAYKEANWKRIAELRKKYDPDGVFFDFTEGLNSQS